LDWVKLQGRDEPTDSPPAYLEDSGYGSITITIEDHDCPANSDSRRDRASPKYFVKLDQNLLTEALTTTFNASTAGVANLTGSVKTPSFHAIAHGGYSDIHYGEWECETATERGRRRFSIRPASVNLFFSHIFLPAHAICVRLL
jgi:hypothetical protein